jgi:hypothetical protein
MQSINFTSFCGRSATMFAGTALFLPVLLITAPCAVPQENPGSERAVECQSVVSIHNRLITKLQPLYAPQKAVNQSMLQKSVKIYDQAAQDMKVLAIQDETLGQIKGEFATMYRSTSQVMKQAMSSSGRKRSTALQKLAQAASPEKELVDRLNTYCGNGK